MKTMMLYVVVFGWGDVTHQRFPMPDLPTCLTAAAAVHYDGSDGDENESGVAAWCGPANGERYSSFNGKWLR